MTKPWSYFLESARNRLRNIFVPPPSATLPWTRHEANLAVHGFLSTRNPPIPNEIILQILDLSSRWIRTKSISAHVATDLEPIRVGSSLQNHGEQQILATNPLSQLEARRIRRIIFTFRSKDQGWSDYWESHGTYKDSYSWFEASLTHPIVETQIEPQRHDQLELKAAKESRRYELQRNRHAGRKPEEYRHELWPDHELLQLLEEGDSVVLWALASFPGWENRIFNASIEVWCVDDLQGIMNSTSR